MDHTMLKRPGCWSLCSRKTEQTKMKTNQRERRKMRKGGGWEEGGKTSGQQKVKRQNFNGVKLPNTEQKVCSLLQLFYSSPILFRLRQPNEYAFSKNSLALYGVLFLLLSFIKKTALLLLYFDFSAKSLLIIITGIITTSNINNIEGHQHQHQYSGKNRWTVYVHDIVAKGIDVLYQMRNIWIFWYFFKILTVILEKICIEAHKQPTKRKVTTWPVTSIHRCNG